MNNNTPHSKLCILEPNQVVITQGKMVDECKITNKVEIVQNLWNYNHVYQNDILKKYPYVGVIPQGPATGSWPCRNGNCNYFSPNNPVIPENFRNIDLLSLPPN